MLYYNQKKLLLKKNINELYDMFPLDRVGAIKILKKAGFIHTEKEQIEKIFDKDTIIKQLLITKKMYFDNKCNDCKNNR